MGGEASNLGASRTRADVTPAPGFGLGDVPGFGSLRSAGELGSLAVATIREAARPPYTWVPDAIAAAATAVRQVLTPLWISITVFMWTFSYIVMGRTVWLLGTEDRVGSGYFIGMTREVSVWIGGMIFAGVAGSALTSSIGARKVREELDALKVLGVNEIRSLVVPNVMAFTFILPVLGMLAAFTAQVMAYVISVHVSGVPVAVWWDSVTAAIYPVDIWGTFIKFAFIGFLVGVVSCHKGRACRPGAGGVGRAVNEAIVISFFGLWMFNSVFNLAMLILFPSLSTPLG